MPAKNFMKRLRDHAMSFFRTGDQAALRMTRLLGKKVILVRFIKPALTSTAKTTDYSAAGLHHHGHLLATHFRARYEDFPKAKLKKRKKGKLHLPSALTLLIEQKRKKPTNLFRKCQSQFQLEMY